MSVDNLVIFVESDLTDRNSRRSQPLPRGRHRMLDTFYETRQYETYIEINIASHNVCCLLDTGCDYSLIPRCLIPREKLYSTEVDVFAANGTRIEILHCTQLRFYVRGLSYND